LLLASGILQSFLFGLTLAAAVGPIALLIVNYGLSQGFRTAFAAGCGAAVADLLYAMLAFIAGSQIVAWLAERQDGFRRISGLALVLLGLWMLWRSWAPGDADKPVAGAATAGTDAQRPFLTTLLLTVVNPLTVLVFVGFAGQLPLGGSLRAAVVLALAVFAGSLMVQTVFALGGAALARVLSNSRWQRLLNGLSGLAIVAFGIHGAWP
jgi:threonine/homoserine/homoserine lactone efflux protein